MTVLVAICRQVHTRLSGCLRRRLVVAAVLAAVLVSFNGAPAPAEPRQSLAVLPFEIEDNSGEAGGPGRHEAMLAGATRAVADKLAQSGLYRIVPETEVAAAIAAVDTGTYLRACNGCELDIAKRAGADRVMVGWLFKMSTLVLTLHVVIKDAATGEIVYARAFDFRGDNEKSWRRAADYMVAALARARSTN